MTHLGRKPLLALLCCAAVAATTDGFELSRVDLALRREGDVLGKSQSGFHSGPSRCSVREYAPSR